MIEFLAHEIKDTQIMTQRVETTLVTLCFTYLLPKPHFIKHESALTA